MDTTKALATLKGNLTINGADLVENVQGIIKFCIGERIWTIDLTEGTGQLFEGEPDGIEPDVTLTMTDDTFSKLVAKKNNPQTAFLFGKMKIKGSTRMALKVLPVLEAARTPASKL